jgi:hypothetical protein
MSPSRRILNFGLLGLALTSVGSGAFAGQIWTVSVCTSEMAAGYTGPFAIDFELVGTNGNTVTLNNFSFGAGGAGPGPAFLTGGASGDLGSTVSLNDSANFFSDFNQQFTPGGMLTFTMDSTLVAPPSGGSPDSFFMVIFHGYDVVNGFDPITGTGGTPIPTTDPTGNDTFFNFSINGPGSTLVSSFPSASGDVTITVTPAGVVPQPSSVVIMLFGVMGMSAALCWRRNGCKQRLVSG